ncbi:MAG: MerR family transcriptional regulator [Dehalococcoidia bacterium]
MASHLTIGALARESGVSVRTIRFYESQGVVPAARRSASGYRLYAASDVRRLRLVRHARLLGLSLPDVRTLIEQAFSSTCESFVPELADLIAGKNQEVLRRIEDLQALRRELSELERHVRNAPCTARPGRVSECKFCISPDGEGA